MHAHFLFFTHNMNALTWDIIIISIPSFPLASFTAFSWFASLHKVLQVGQCLCTGLGGAEWSRVEQVQGTKTSYQKYLQSSIPNCRETLISPTPRFTAPHTDTMNSPPLFGSRCLAAFPSWLEVCGTSKEKTGEKERMNER